jgi:cytochrome P450
MEASVRSDIPSHVPDKLVVTLPLYARKVVYDCPQDTLIPEMHATLPPISYATNIFPGDQPGWLLTRFEDTQAILRDADNFTKNGMGRWAQNIGESWLVLPTEADPPVHSEYRKVMNPSFSPQKMLAQKGQLQERARALLADFKETGECDFVKQFSEKFPVNIVLDLLGLPQERMWQFLIWEKEMLHTNDLQVRGNAVKNVKNFLLEEIRSRRENPRDDYITRVLSYRFEDRPWSDDEVFGHCFNLYIGGLDTVTSVLGMLFNYLAVHPELQAQLRGNPNLIVLAVEEMLRCFAPVTAFRIATKELTIHGQKIMPGEYVSMSTPVVSRDPTFYTAPQEFRMERREARVVLGGGIHKCLGMHLARLELQTAVEEFLSALPEFRIKDGFKVPYFVGNILHIPDLQLQWN